MILRRKPHHSKHDLISYLDDLITFQATIPTPHIHCSTPQNAPPERQPKDCSSKILLSSSDSGISAGVGIIKACGTSKSEGSGKVSIAAGSKGSESTDMIASRVSSPIGLDGASQTMEFTYVRSYFYFDPPSTKKKHRPLSLPKTFYIKTNFFSLISGASFEVFSGFQ